MNNKSINSNKQFMIGNGILAFGVFFIVCLFLYLGFRNQSKSNDKEKTFAGIYTVEIADSFTGDSLSVYINDSLLFNSNIGDAAVKFQVKRFAEESTLMVVDNHTDEITPFNLNPEGSQIAVEKKTVKSLFRKRQTTKEKRHTLLHLQVNFLLFSTFLEANPYVFLIGNVRLRFGKRMFQGRET